MSARPTGFLGLSHLGIISSIGWASLGSRVIAVDLDREAVERLGRGELPVHEPGLPELLAATRDRIQFSSEPSALAECDLVIVSRDIPTDADNGSDPEIVHRLIEAAIPHLRRGSTLVLMSQVSPGATRALAGRIEARRPGSGIAVYYWVETLIFGNAVERFLRPERLIVGAKFSQLEAKKKELDVAILTKVMALSKQTGAVETASKPFRTAAGPKRRGKRPI